MHVNKVIALRCLTVLLLVFVVVQLVENAKNGANDEDGGS